MEYLGFWLTRKGVRRLDSFPTMTLPWWHVVGGVHRPNYRGGGNVKDQLRQRVQCTECEAELVVGSLQTHHQN